MGKEYRTIMMKEILEEPDTIEKTVESASENLKKAIEVLKKSQLVYITGSGTSFHASMVMQITLLKFGIPAVAVMASELRNYIPSNFHGKISVILFSQSGESKDIIDSLDISRNHGYYTIGITNLPHSRLAKNSDITIMTSAGEEKSVAATKSHVSQLLLAVMATAYLGSEMETLELRDIQDKIKEIFNSMDNIRKLSDIITNRLVFLGNGYLYAVALEASLKFKETGNIITEAYPLREYLHGPIQALDKTTTVFILDDGDMNYNDIYNKVKEYTQHIITLSSSHRGDINLAKLSVVSSTIAFIVPLQIMANFKALNLGTDPDNPDHLTKVVK
jgi:glucosamine--fructose-6-phosphate aminotransferase (isomerizing)